LKILVVNWQDIKNPYGGGAEVHLHEIFKRVVLKGHEVFLLSCKIDNQPDYEEIDGIKVFRKGSRSIFNYFVPKMYKEISQKFDFDIVIDDLNKIPFYTPLFVKKPLLAISHHFFGTSIYKETNFIAGSYVYLSEALVNIVYKNTPFVVVSESTLNEFKSRGFDTSKFRIVYNAIEQDNFPLKVVKKNDYLTITYFGRLKKYKSVDHLFRAYATIKNKFPNSKLEIIGRGDFKDELVSLSKELNIFDSVIFHGFVTEEQKSDLLSKSHVVVNTSLKEGWGITNIEANACGTPVISADVPGLRDSVSPGLSGLLYPYSNIKELARQIDEILSDEKLRNTLSEGAVEWAKKFSWNKSADDMIEVMEKVISDFRK
jgi:glycosyltransferase involved in cell wall biosynthesis